MTPLRTAALGLAALALAAGAGSAAIPPAAAPAAFPTVGSYDGALFPAEDLLARGLACNLIAGGLTCYDSPAQATAAGPRPRPGAACHPALRLWKDAGRSGNPLALYDTGYWRNLPDSWRNQVSSFSTGCDHAGRIADLPDGGGAQLEGPPETSYPVMPAGWDDRADAVYRG